MEGKSQREIERITGITTKTIRKYLKEYQAELENLDKSDQMAVIEAPKYDVSHRKKLKLSDEVVSRIDYYLSINEENRRNRMYKQLMKKIDIFEALREEGIDIGYTTVCNYIKEKESVKEAFIRQSYALGETLEFDYGEVKLEIDGKLRTLNLGLFTTAHNSFHFGYLYRSKHMESFLDVHIRAFRTLSGVYKEVVYDNLKQGVKRFVENNKRELTDDLQKISLYYGFNPRFANKGKGNEKGHVERGVEYIRRKVFSRNTKFSSVKEANDFLTSKLKKLNAIQRPFLNNRSPLELQMEEQKFLIPVVKEYDASRRLEARVNKYSLVIVDQVKYSVPDYLVDKFCNIKLYPEEVVISYRDNEVARHKRSFVPHSHVLDINHFLRTLKKKPGALHNATARHQQSQWLKQLYTNYYTDKPKDFIDLLEMIKENGDEEVKKAIKTLEMLDKKLVKTENIKNQLSNQNNRIAKNSPLDIDIIIRSSHDLISQIVSVHGGNN